MKWIPRSSRGMTVFCHSGLEAGIHLAGMLCWLDVGFKLTSLSFGYFFPIVMTPLQRYQQQIQSGKFQANPLQEQALLQFQRVYDELTAPKKLFRKKNHVKGLFVWGGVGIGKTWLMDIFCECLPLPKVRLHFHRFMRQVHEELKRYQGQPDPLKLVAKHFAQHAKVICLDEFLVHDITDAMILANLLEALFAEQIVVITTANTQPDDLYRNGLQRSRFLPAIALIKQYLAVYNLNSETDYRLRDLTEARTYFYPLNETSAKSMERLFAQLTYGSEVNVQPLETLGRTIVTNGYARNTIWFDFNIICNIPRSQRDYLEIAEDFSTVFVSNVPQITISEVNQARLFIHLVDVFYDAHVKLILSAAVPIQDIYLQGDLHFEFERTKSRLLEMQSKVYLHKRHLESGN